MNPSKSGRTAGHKDDWSSLKSTTMDKATSDRGPGDDHANGGIRREPTLPDHEAVAPEPGPPQANEFVFDEEIREEDNAVRARALRGRIRQIARQASLDPNDGVDL